MPPFVAGMYNVKARPDDLDSKKFPYDGTLVYALNKRAQVGLVKAWFVDDNAVDSALSDSVILLMCSGDSHGDVGGEAEGHRGDCQLDAPGME